MSQDAYETVKNEFEHVAERGFNESSRRVKSSLQRPEIRYAIGPNDVVSRYIDAVKEFNDLGMEIMQAVDSNDYDDPVAEHLPKEMRYISDVRTYLREPEGPATYELDNWVFQHHDTLLYTAISDEITDEEFEEELRLKAEDLDIYPDNLRNKTAGRSLERMYDSWDEAGIEWGRHLRELVKDGELGLHEAILRRRVLSHEAVSYATQMLNELDD